MFWYANFLQDGSGYVSSALFATTLSVWPTKPAPPQPEPSPTFPFGASPVGRAGLLVPLYSLALPAGGISFAVPSPTAAWIAGAAAKGTVHLLAREGTPPVLAPLDGTAAPTALAFARSGRQLAALHEGEVHVWSLAAPR